MSGLERQFGEWLRDFAPECGDLASLVRDRIVYRSVEANAAEDPRDRIELRDDARARMSVDFERRRK